MQTFIIWEFEPLVDLPMRGCNSLLLRFHAESTVSILSSLYSHYITATLVQVTTQVQAAQLKYNFFLCDRLMA